MEWADLNRLIESEFHHYTQELFELENEIQTPIHDSMHWSRRFEYPWILTQLKSADLSSVLDVGSGATALQFMLAKANVPVTSIDIDQEALNWVNKRTTRPMWMAPASGMMTMTEGRKPKAIDMNINRLTFPDDSFGTVICISVLEHLSVHEILPAIRNMIRIAKTNVLITMDVCLNSINQIDLPRFKGLMEALNVETKPLPQTALTFNVLEQKFAVACLRFTK